MEHGQYVNPGDSGFRVVTAYLDIRLDDVGYGSRTDSIAVGKLGMGQPSPQSFVQLKQYLTTLQYSFTSLLIMDCFLKHRPFVVTEINDVCLGSCHSRHRRFFLV